MTIYIAGKITGDKDYRAKFARYEKRVIAAGDVCLNPAVMPCGLTNSEYMRFSFAMIDAADIVYFLPDWEQSEGAKLEMAYCVYVNKPYAIAREKEKSKCR